MQDRTIFYIYAGVALLYLGLLVTLPPNPVALERYDLSVVAYRWLNVAVAIPTIAIWLAAAYGYIRLKAYGSLIGKSPEGRPVRLITKGILLLALSLPVGSFMGLLRNALQSNADAFAAMTIIANYVSLLVPLVAFIFIGAGARGLTELSKQRPPRYAAHGLILLFAIMSVGYSYMVLQFAFSGQAASNPVYFMPLWLVMVSLVVPYLYSWFIGLTAAYEIYLYNSAVKGVLYRRSWSTLSLGVGTIVVTLTAVQYLTTVSVQLNRLSVVAVIELIYGLLGLLAVGYILVARGAKRLQKIEEV